ncbi:bestrophin family protein [Hymenobacter terrenus]|uniref:bestrophin family protein n=1 Tax=Hymenobacter terrenus TaxID=1629124 RepID=UPI000619D209|nr:bestrophin family ion channel [Hymenobacter terrenus]
MYVRRNIRPGLILRFAWKNLLLFIFWATVVTFGYAYLRRHYGLDIRLPFLPLSTIGIAVAFYLGFKNNQSYDRFWEGRKTWGGIVNQSRSWASQVQSYVTNLRAALPLAPAELHAVHQELIYRQLAWLNALRLQLRRTTIHDRRNMSYVPDLHLPAGAPGEPQVQTFLSEAEYVRVTTTANAAAQLLHQQSLRLQQLREQDLIDDFRHVDLMQTIKECYNLQGACERIKNTPFPRQYAYFSTLFTWIFVWLLPLGLVSEFSKLESHSFVWLTIPFSVLISWIFTTMEIVGDNSEDPFENYVNDVPMTAICRTIEIDLRQMLGETALPPRMQPVDDILL